MTIPVVRLFIEYAEKTTNTKNPAILYLERSQSESSPGQLCLPGGKVNDTHASAIDRELQEEVGFKPPKNHSVRTPLYLFSQEPNQGYREDFFQVGLDNRWNPPAKEYVRSSLNEESTDAHVLTLEESLKRDDIAYANDVAHFYYAVRNLNQEEYTNPHHELDFYTNLISWQLNGTIPNPITIPSHHSVTQQKDLQKYLAD
jgi:ADP-ribose pyrophosphatase YjhB (NUDIX family)